MNNDEDNHQQDNDNDAHTPGISDLQQQRLHRLVLPLILDLLRSRNRSATPLESNERTSNGNSRMFEETATPSDSDATHDTDMEDADWFTPGDNETASTSNVVDEAQQHNEDATPLLSDTMEDEEPQPPSSSNQPLTNQQGQLIASPPSTSSPRSRRSRYRLVVYFEDRDASSSSLDTRDPISSPSRYVAIFSIDSDAHNMPVIQSADFQQSPGSIDDILNQLFAAYCPKGTPPAKKEIIDSLPTTKYTSCLSSQPKCAVCLEDFEEGTDTVELPCSHRFHGESCVKQWLRMHSSCPVCRHEMPVDDIEYEEKRKARMPATTPPSESMNTTDDAIL